MLALCRAFLHSGVGKGRLVLFSFVTALGECLLLCFPVGSPWAKLILGFGGMTAGNLYFLFRPRNGESFLKILAVCYGSAILLGGSLGLAERSFRSFKIPFLLLPLLAGGVSFILLRLLRLAESYGRASITEAEIVFSDGRSCRLLALWDTGNGLIEPISGKPVSLVEEKALLPYQDILEKEPFRVVPYHSIGCNKGMLRAYIPERLSIQREGERLVIEKPIIGITKESISANENYQMILHPALQTLRRNDL